MALGTAIKESNVKTALGESTDDIFTLCIANSINKWSRSKPVRVKTAFSHGLNFPTNWDYLKPRGNSVSPEEPGWLNHFSGYNHTAVPPLHMSFYPTGAGGSSQAGFIVDIVTGSSTELDIEDFGLENWYFGIKLNAEYKSAIDVNLNINTLGNDARSVFFTIGSGNYTWEAFVSDAACVGGAEPDTYIMLPAFTGYVISGSFSNALTNPYYTFTNNVDGVNVGGPYTRGEDHIHFHALNIGAGVEVQFWCNSISIGTAWIDEGTMESPVETTGIIGNVPALGYNEAGEIIVEQSI